jgi:hypothetical protein
MSFEVTLYWAIGIVLFDLCIMFVRVEIPPFKYYNGPDDCVCGKVFIPKLLPADAPEGAFSVLMVMILIFFVLIPVFIPQELVRRYFHNRKCLPYQMDRMVKKDESR